MVSSFNNSISKPNLEYRIKGGPYRDAKRGVKTSYGKCWAQVAYRRSLLLGR